jgi:hypothetical protein
MASWLDDLLGKQLQADGVNLPMRKILNLIGVVAEDDSANGATKVTIAGSAGYGAAKISVASQANGGVSAYPSDVAQAIGIATFVRTAVNDHDSIRFPANADAIVPVTIGLRGRVQNNTDKVIDLYPPAGVAIAVDGVSLGVDTPVELPPFGSLAWMVDFDGTFYVFG